MGFDESDSPFIAVLCPVCGSENEIDPKLERFFCFRCGKQSFTKAAIAFTKAESKTNAEDSTIPNISSEDDKKRAVKRSYVLLEDGETARALSFAEAILDFDPECAHAYTIRLLAALRLKSVSDLCSCPIDFISNRDFLRACEYADSELALILNSAKESFAEYQEAKKKSAYDKGTQLLSAASSPEDLRLAAKLFTEAGDYADARSLASNALSSAEALWSAEEARKSETYKLANRMRLGVAPGGPEKAAELFDSLNGWKDSVAQAKACRLLVHDDRNFIDRNF